MPIYPFFVSWMTGNIGISSGLSWKLGRYRLPQGAEGEERQIMCVAHVAVNVVVINDIYDFVLFFIESKVRPTEGGSGETSFKLHMNIILLHVFI